MPDEKKRKHTVSRILVSLLSVSLAAAVQPSPPPSASAAGHESGTSRLGKVAYVRHGDLWSRELPDGAERRLTTSGDNHAPLWSSSGEWLAYRHKDAELWAVPASGGKGKRVASGVNDVLWSPTDDILVYDTSSIVLAKPPNWKGSSPATFPKGHKPEVSGFAWSPDGTSIAFGLMENPSYGAIWVVRADGTTGTDLWTYDPSGMNGAEVVVTGWSPDGKEVHFLYPYSIEALLGGDVSLMTVSVEDKKPRRLLGQATDSARKALLANASYYATSPDGKTMMVIAGGEKDGREVKQVVTVDLASGAVDSLTSSADIALSPAWSPDGSSIAYASELAAGTGADSSDSSSVPVQRRIWAMTKDGSGKRMVSSNSTYWDERPLWSSDGQYLLFGSVGSDSSGSLWLVHRDGSNPRCVVRGIRLADSDIEAESSGGQVSWGDYCDWWKGPPGNQQK